MENLINHICSIKKEWDSYLKNALIKYDITHSEFNGIEVLDTKEKLSSSSIADRMNLSPSRASRVIENMVKKKVLIRDIDCNDRRKCTIELTERGLEIKKKIEEIKSEFYNVILKGFDDDELGIIYDNLLKIIDNIEKKKLEKK